MSSAPAQGVSTAGPTAAEAPTPGEAPTKPETGPWRRRLTVASFVVVVLVAATLVWFATHARGEPVRTVRLHDGGVWVSNSARNLVGRLSTATAQLDAGVAVGDGVPGAAGSLVDVVQDGPAVVGLAGSPVRVLPIDPDTAAVRDTPTIALPLPSKATGLPYAVPLPIDVRGGTVAVVDPSTGRLWAGRVGADGAVHSLAALAPSVPPLAVVGATAAVAVGEDGTVYAASAATGSVVTIGVDAATGRLGTPVTAPLGFTSKAVELTVLGSRWVAFDPATALLHAAGLTTPITVSDDSQAQTGGLAQVALQQPAAAAASVLVQTPNELKVVPLDQDTEGGTVVALADSARIDGQGNPLPVILTRPVRAGACLHGAWTVTAKVWYGRSCAGATAQKTAQQAVELGSLARGSHVAGVRLRVNRGLVVLDDLDSGSLWDVDGDPVRIDDWAAASPQVQGS